ncbi:hypothetical protein, partial [Pseudomonas abietaniphila]|uniref:hypothetical protein n=1 Tax=Pseudomonas abietaniphila TaxID=89065 RepID=UPI000AF49FC7
RPSAAAIAAWNNRAAPVSPASGEPDFKTDENALEIFSKLMAHKLAKKSQEGRHGWQRMSQQELTSMLREHVEKGDPVDVANFCMMLCANGFKIGRSTDADTAALQCAQTIVGIYQECLLKGEVGSPRITAKIQCEVIDTVNAQVTRLQAENAALQQRLNVADQRVCDLTAERGDLEAYAAALREDFTTLQSDLTKALELLEEASCSMPFGWQSKVRKFLAPPIRASREGLLKMERSNSKILTLGMDNLADIPYANETPAEWDADYRKIWQELQVASRNKVQLLTYIKNMREELKVVLEQLNEVISHPQTVMNNRLRTKVLEFLVAQSEPAANPIACKVDESCGRDGSNE